MENFTCEMCKYIDEECDGEHCSKCIWQRYTMFKLDYVKQIAKDFNCSRSLAKEMYHSMIVTYRIKRGGKNMTFKEFTDVCGNWHIQCNVSVIKYDHVLYEGEWSNMPKIIRKCYDINRFYVNSVEMKSFSLYVRLKPEYSYKLYEYLKYKLNKKFGRII